MEVSLSAIIRTAEEALGCQDSIWRGRVGPKTDLRQKGGGGGNIVVVTGSYLYVFIPIITVVLLYSIL